MKYQKRYKPKTKFEKFLKVYFIIGILVIVLTGVYAGVKSMQRKKEVASETIRGIISNLLYLFSCSCRNILWEREIDKDKRKMPICHTI